MDIFLHILTYSREYSCKILICIKRINIADANNNTDMILTLFVNRAVYYLISIKLI